MKLISSHIFYLLSGILVGVEWSVCSVAPTRQDYDDLDRSRRNTVSIGNNMVLMKYSECSKLSASCKALDDIDFVTCIFSKKRVEDSMSVERQSCLIKAKSYVLRFLKDSSLREVVDSYCTPKDWTILNTCNYERNQDGGLLMCMFDSVNNVGSSCATLVQRLKVVPFLTMDTLMPFLKHCQRDIDQNRCSGFKSDRQMKTIHCMQSHIESLGQACRDQVLYLSEVQADIASNDRAYVADCSREVQLYCSDFTNLDQIYLCLSAHKDSQQFSKQCKDEIFEHEKVIARDYQVSKGLAKACKEDIRQHQCRKSVSNHKYVRLSQILLCLENASHSGGAIKDMCLKEMVAHRRLLMDDFRLSPELVTRCSDDIEKFCGHGGIGAKTIHCLMEHSRPSSSRSQVSAECQRQLESLMKEADVTDDWTVDPILSQDCHDVVNIACKKVSPSEVMSCLMKQLGGEVMTEDCETSLLQIQYFVARDYKLDSKLYKACHANAVSLCHAAKDWAPGPSTAMDPERGPLVLPCLYRYASLPPAELINKMSDDCKGEIKRVMRERALSVELHPEIETACLNDLAEFCVDKTAHKQEIICLQDKLEKLTPKCKETVFNFTEMQSAHIELNPIILTNCLMVIDSLCKKVYAGADVIECLIEHKNHQLMKYHTKCKAAIDHHQLISLKNYHFTLKFKEACENYVNRYCSDTRTKLQVVTCLSEVMRNDTLLNQKQKIPKECRQQIRAQLLQSRENINLNPQLRQACTDDIRSYCKTVTAGNANVLECLQSNRVRLSANCHRMIFRIERQDLYDSSTDYTLQTTCQTMIAKYCQHNDTKDALACLKRYKYYAEFDPACRVVVVRRMIEQFSDYRLNPGLMGGCRTDVARFCAPVLANHATSSDETELNGKVISCLKNKFRERKLFKECEKKLIIVLQESALNYQLNPLLTQFCETEIKTLCFEEKRKDQMGGGGVEECLKRSLIDNKITNKHCKEEVLELIQESKADIEADPLLHTACLRDIHIYCSHVSKGAKRQLSCLMEVLDANEGSKQLQVECKSMLSQRISMYKMEEQVQNLNDVYNHLSHSPSRKYFMVVALTFVGMVFITGMFCGRMVRRSHTLLKNK